MFNKRLKLFVAGRKDIFVKLEKEISEKDKVIWVHCASLGEFEQGRPIIESLKSKFSSPPYKIIISFFSPSGYEVRKNFDKAYFVTYLPLDTKKNAKKWMQLLHPYLAIFVKYEFWPNMLRELKSHNTKTLLISGIFRENQIFFRSNFSWYRNQLRAFSHFFVQDQTSNDLLYKIGFQNISISGDTRFDRVYELSKHPIKPDYINEFCLNAHVLVAGSTWPPDEDILLSYINEKAQDFEKFILVPHNIDLKEIKKLKHLFRKKTILYSTIDAQNYKEAQVIIIDSIGLLSSLYAYAKVAYIGGGFGLGIHNVLEPAAYGIPIVIGPKYQKFREAVDLIELGACQSVHDKNELFDTLKLFAQNEDVLNKTGLIAKHYVQTNKGATEKILHYIEDEL